MSISLQQNKVYYFSLLVIGLLVASFVIFRSFHIAGTVHQGSIRPIRTSDGRARRNNRDQLYSSNWSGYAVAKYQTGKKYTSATATWIVPAVSSSPVGYSSSWIGIGGFCLNSSCSRVDKSLIQLGTEQDSSGNYYAWYEMLPQAETKISGFAVNAGDTITASLVMVSANKKSQTWQLTLTDGANVWSSTFNYKSSLASSEWIEEAPYSGSILPLANFGTATFDPGTADNSNPALNWGNAIIMQNPNGQTSNPSSPDSDTDGFNACWGAGSTLTPCSSPSS